VFETVGLGGIELAPDQLPTGGLGDWTPLRGWSLVVWDMVAEDGFATTAPLSEAGPRWCWPPPASTDETVPANVPEFSPVARLGWAVGVAVRLGMGGVGLAGDPVAPSLELAPDFTLSSFGGVMPVIAIVGIDGRIHHRQTGFTEGDEKRIRSVVESPLTKETPPSE